LARVVASFEIAVALAVSAAARVEAWLVLADAREDASAMIAVAFVASAALAAVASAVIALALAVSAEARLLTEPSVTTTSMPLVTSAELSASDERVSGFVAP
jgi:uncharacterized membrane protein YciS (DUF1049 family)